MDPCARKPGAGKSIAGTYQISGTGLDNSGAVSGTFVDPDRTLALAPTDTTKLTYNVTARWTGDEIRAMYTTSACLASRPGR